MYVADQSRMSVRRIDAETGVITTLAGTGERGFGGDGGPATEASLDSPTGLAIDVAGNLYVADSANRRVRRINAVTGVIDTLAGTGTWTYVADGRPATEALLSSPAGLAVDATGNVYFAELGHGLVRRVDAETGVISTLAGTGERKHGGDGGPATEAGLSSPAGVAVDAAGAVYVADRSTYRVRRIDASTGVITTIAGTGERGFTGDGGPAIEARLFAPTAVAVDAASNVYVADTGNGRVRRIDADTGEITTIAGGGGDYPGDGGPASEARLRAPEGLAVDATGNVYVADTGNNRVCKIDISTGIITTVAGTGDQGYGGDGGPASEALLQQPMGLALNTAGDVYVADSGNLRVRRIDADTGEITTVAGGGRHYPGYGGPAVEAQIMSPHWLAVGAAGDLYIVESAYFGKVHLVKRSLSPGGRFLLPAGSNGDRPSFTVSEDGLLMWSDGTPVFEGELFQASNGEIYKLMTGADGSIAAVYARKSAISVNADGTFELPPGAELTHSAYLFHTVAGTGERGYAGDGGPASEAILNSVVTLAVDGAGNVFFGDALNYRIRRIDASTGVITTVAGTGERGYARDGAVATETPLGIPWEMTVDGHGNVFFGDTRDYRIRRIDASTGVITTVTGTHGPGYAGDGGPASEALFDDVGALAVDGSGNVFVADSGNHRIRRIDASTGVITTVAGTGQPGYAEDEDGAVATETPLRLSAAMAVDAAGNVFFGRDRIRRIDAATGVITTIAGGGSAWPGDGGPPTEARTDPDLISVDSAGNIFFVQPVSDGYHIRRIEASTGVIATIARGGQYNPEVMAVDRTGVGYVADSEEHRVLTFRELHRIKFPLGSSGQTVELWVDGNGRLWTEDARIRGGERFKTDHGFVYGFTVGPDGGRYVLPAAITDA